MGIVVKFEDFHVAQEIVSFLEDEKYEGFLPIVNFVVVVAVEGIDGLFVVEDFVVV